MDETVKVVEQYEVTAVICHTLCEYMCSHMKRLNYKKSVAAAHYARNIPFQEHVHM